MLKRQLFKEQTGIQLDTHWTTANKNNHKRLNYQILRRSSAVKQLSSSVRKHREFESQFQKEKYFSLEKRKIQPQKLFKEIPQDSTKGDTSHKKMVKEEKGQKTYNLKIKKLKKTSQINEKSRYILIDWLSQVSEQLKISKQALHQAIFYLDKLTHKIKIAKNQYQYFGLTCLFISHKIDAKNKIISYSQASDLVEYSLSLDDFLILEQKVLKSLKFKVNPFTIWNQMNMLLSGFKSFLKKQIYDVPHWKEIQNKALWICEGIVMCNSYAVKSNSQKNICLQILSHLLKEKYSSCQILSQKFNKFSSFLSESFIPQSSLTKQILFWINSSCQCEHPYNMTKYHPELKELARAY